ncbi:MAG: 1-acyl-sn-glycerol-3-phosphate acyltransferase [Kofleriaceae bacterium]|nr:1-acyl-sn-glycerol-3-phosphate acyltransferase [Kofleriaceae bacterium]
MSLLTRPIRLPHLSPYVPKPEDPPIFWFNSERDDIVREVVRRMVEREARDAHHAELALNEVAFHEVRRLETQRDDEARESLGFYRGLTRRVARMSDGEKKQTVTHIAERMARDIAGNFDPRVYAFSRHVVPRVLTGAMRPSSLGLDLLSRGASIDQILTTEGPIDRLRALSKIGTLVMVPTHSSNLDSIAVGYALQREELPPVSYGAGKNLFSNPIISFFMHNLGAYRLDRRIRSVFYKEVLKTYSCVMIERGYHSLFFPGGTRSRSGMIEKHLKLGLAGTGVEAFARNQVRGVTRPVFFVPATINYALVLEAESLIEDWLKEAGKARYIIEDDEFSQLDRWLDFFRKLTGMSAACIIRFGQPLDPFCNEVDDEGRSVGPRGRTLDPGSYVARGGVPVVDAARDAAYTRDLGEAIAGRFLRETVIMATQLVAHVLYRELVRVTPGVDLFGRLRLRGDVSMQKSDVYRAVGDVRDTLLRLEREDRVRVSPFLRRETPERIVSRVLEIFAGYHTRTVAKDLGAEISIEDPTLLFYYQNRLLPWCVDVAHEERDLPAAREIAASWIKA